MEKFRIRPEYGGANLLFEFCGDHGAEGYPNVSMLLAEVLGAISQKHPVFSAETMIATDRYLAIGRIKTEPMRLTTIFGAASSLFRTVTLKSSQT
jgi:hypothetical protein